MKNDLNLYKIYIKKKKSNNMLLIMLFYFKYKIQFHEQNFF
jgi:hypothetical protein